MDPSQVGSILDLGVSAGDLGAIGPTGIVVSDDFATESRLRVGDVVPSQFLQSGVQVLLSPPRTGSGSCSATS